MVNVDEQFCTCGHHAEDHYYSPDPAGYNGCAMLPDHHGRPAPCGCNEYTPRPNP